MFTNNISERIFTIAWEDGYIHRRDWVALTSELVDENTHAIVARLMHAIRRGRLSIID